MMDQAHARRPQENATTPNLWNWIQLNSCRRQPHNTREAENTLEVHSENVCLTEEQRSNRFWKALCCTGVASLSRTHTLGITDALIFSVWLPFEQDKVWSNITAALQSYCVPGTTPNTYAGNPASIKRLTSLDVLRATPELLCQRLTPPTPSPCASQTRLVLLTDSSKHGWAF